MLAARFKPWRDFKAETDKSRIRLYLATAGRNAAFRFHEAQEEPKSGRLYLRNGTTWVRRSAPGEFPKRETGLLKSSIDFRVYGYTRMVIGSAMPYSIFLRYGTSKMKPRKMSPDALTETLPAARPALAGFVRWRLAA